MRVICPKCKVPTSEFTFEADLVLDRCDRCHGLWLDHGELARLSGGRDDFPGPPERSGPQTLFNCPKCLLVRLQEVRFMPNGSLIVEVCISCRGHWLDSRELRTALDLLHKNRIEEKKKRKKNPRSE